MAGLETLTIATLVEATGGRLLAGDPERPLNGVSIDSRTLAAGQLFVAIVGPRFDGHDFVAAAAERGAVALLVQREVAAPAELAVVRVDDTTRALGALAQCVRRLAALPVVCITGSVGKTTTKDMTATLLAARGSVLKTEGNLNNQYGLPLTLLRLRPEHVAAVLELGMSGFGELRYLSGIAEPDVAVITLVAPVHLEFFASVEEIARAKAEILEGLRTGGAAVLNYDDPRLREVGQAFAGEVVWFGRDRACAVSAENWRGTVHGMRFDLRIEGRTADVALPLAGPHFLTNFLAAAAAAHRLGLDLETIAGRAGEMKPAPHRGQVLSLGQGVTLIDDGYNSSPVAVEAAVTALGLSAKGRRVAFLGDMLELGARGPELHRDLGRRLARRLDVLVGVGVLGREFLAGAAEGGLPASARLAFPDAPAAAAAAPGLVQAGDAVLVKGSRGVRMESIVTALVAHLGEAER